MTGSATTEQEVGASAPSLPTRIRRSSPRLRHHRPRTIPIFERELPEDSRWIEGYYGKYAISSAGTVFRYHGDGRQHELKTTTQGKTVWLLITQEFQTARLKVAEEVARAFLGTRWFVFRDGDSLNPALSNLRPIDAPMEPNELWIPGYEFEYAVTRNGQVWSYKNHRRRLLKKADRLCLTDVTGKQKSVSISKVIRNIF